MCQLVRFKPADRRAFLEALSRIPPEMWANAYDDGARRTDAGAMWTTLAALDVLREQGVRVEPVESLEAELMPVFFGPGASVHAKLMAADLRCRTLAAGAVGAIRAGEGAVEQVAAKTGLRAADLMPWQPPFSPPYVWLLIRRREEALPAAERLYAGSEAARTWAERFGVSSLEALLNQARPGIPAKVVPEPA
ncbi:MAG: hypothetical protein HY660_09980 [Armatimonadetes bacterium]|nr:hypothetical protein [Armatimonadota bacterium]